MPKEPSVAELNAERSETLRAALAGSIEEAWQRVRQHLIDSPSIRRGEAIHTIWEGPSRGLLLPLPFEVLRDFVRQFRPEAIKLLAEALHDSEPNVVGYALHALSRIEPDRFSEYVQVVADRSESIHAIYGSFGWEGSLAEYAIHLRDDVCTTERRER